MVNGPGQAVFLGKRSASQFDPSGATSPGTHYIPDQVAKQIVRENELQKNHTISKRDIVAYLEAAGLSAGLAPDVAMVLRNVYGVTPTFDESLMRRSSSLIGELTSVLNESYPAPFIDKGPEILTEQELLQEALQEAFSEADGPLDEAVIAVLSEESLESIEEMSEFCEWAGPELLGVIEELTLDCEPGIAEAFIDALLLPHRIRFMPEHIQEQLKPLTKGQAKRFPSAHKIISPEPSARKQAKLHAKDIGKEDPLAKKAEIAKKHPEYPKVKAKADAITRAGDIKAMKARQGAKAKAAKGPSALARAGKKTTDVLRKAKEIGGKEITKKGSLKGAGQALKKAAGWAARKAGRGVLHTVGAAGQVAGAAAGGIVRGAMGQAKKATDPGSAEKSGAKKSDEKPGILHKLGAWGRKAIDKVKAGAASAAEKNLPGTSDVVSKAKEKAKEKAQAAGDATTGRRTGLHADSVELPRSGSLLSEVSHVLSGTSPEPLTEETAGTLAQVTEGLVGNDLMDEVAIECLSQLEWEDVSRIASLVLIPGDKLLPLVQAMAESTAAFRREWNDVTAKFKMPEGVDRACFVSLARVGLDEGMVPKTIYWAARALQSAGPAVEAYVRESYPELGKTAYGPAGCPKEGPEMAKAYGTPYPAGVLSPTAGAEVQQVRMFTDPADRAKERASRLREIEGMLRDMEGAAEKADVPPEGMFLNTYRDLHREKVRYS